MPSRRPLTSRKESAASLKKSSYQGFEVFHFQSHLNHCSIGHSSQAHTCVCPISFTTPTLFLESQKTTQAERDRSHLPEIWERLYESCEEQFGHSRLTRVRSNYQKIKVVFAH